MMGDLRIDDFGAERLEPAEGAFLVGFDQARIAGDIGREDRGKTTHDCGDFGHGFPFAQEYSRAHQLSHGSARSTRPDPARGAS
jgi:hypothetical protein